MDKAIFLFVLCFVGQYACQVDIRVVHINDMHGRVDGIPRFGSGCSDDGSDPGDFCDGGWPRMFTAAKKFVDEAPGLVIFLEDGDQFMGTIWSTFYKGIEASTFLNLLCGPRVDGGAGFDACVGSIGNHEFDFGYDTLLSYTKNLDYDLVSANVVDTCGEGELGSHLHKSVVFELEGTKVGVVGYITPQTAFISDTPSCVQFQDEITVLKEEVALLQEQGVDIIIGLGHSGYLKDQQIAQEVEGLDIVVGGHSHTFLWNETVMGENPLVSGGIIRTSIGGDYPTVTNQHGVPVVQAFFGSRYMGMIDLSFDADGVLLDSTPGTVLVGKKDDSSESAIMYQFEEDPLALEVMNELRIPLLDFIQTIIGNNLAVLSAERELMRAAEAPLGNAICDSVKRDVNGKDNDSAFVEQFGPVEIVFYNGGGIRASLDEGDVTVEEVLTVLPFANVVTVIRLTGQQLYLAAENSVHEIGFGLGGHFLQVSKGFEIYYDSTFLAGCGIEDDNIDCVGGVPCSTCKVGDTVTRVYRLALDGIRIPNDNSTSYIVAMNDFLAGGNDGYEIFRDAEVLLASGNELATVFQTYIEDQTEEFGGLVAELDGRIADTPKIASPSPTPSVAPTPPTTPVPPPVAGASQLVPSILSVCFVAMAWARQ